MAARAQGRRRWLRPPSAPAALVAVVVVVAAYLVFGGEGPTSRVAYAAVQQGNVTATAGAAGDLQSADTREVGFGTSGTVTNVYVAVGQQVKEGQTLAKIDDTKAKEDVNAADAALAAAEEAQDTAGTTAGAAGGSRGGGSTCALAAGFTGSASTSSGTTAMLVRLQPVPSPSGTTSPSPSPTVTPTPTPTATPTPTPTLTPTPTPTPTPSTPPTTKPPTSGRPTHSPAPPGRTTPGRARPGGRPGSAGGASCGGVGGAGGAASRPSGPGAGSGTGGQNGQNSGQMTVAQAAAQVVQAQVTLDQANRALAGTTIKAPISGTVLTVAGPVGSQVSGPGSSGFVAIGDLNELQVVADFSQTDVAKLRIGQPASITLGSRPGSTYSASVTHIDAAATNSGGLVQYPVRLAFDDQPPDLLMGQSATALVTTAAAADALYVPTSALRSGPQRTYTVEVRNGTGTQIRTVQVGIRGDRYIQIRSGLTTGDQVVVTPSAGASPDAGFPGS